ncbi:MAG: YbhN family protein [Ilumatobacter sp.]
MKRRLGSGADLLKSRRFWVRLLVLLAVLFFLVRPLVPRVGNAAGQLEVVNPWLTALGFGLQVASLLCYSVMTRAALGEGRNVIGLGRLFRIQLVSRAVSSTVPGGAAAGPTVGYRLMTSAGVYGQRASAALASASVISAVVLNVLLWSALVVSVPSYGFNAVYAGAAVLGILLMLAVAAVLLSIVDGSQFVQRPVRFFSQRVGADPDRVMLSVRNFGEQIQLLGSNRRLLRRLSCWAACNWLLDALSLWVFLRAFGVAMNPVGVLVAFGVANVLAAIPISPGGIGIVEWAYLPILITFGATLEQATIAVTSYRVAQFLFPIVLGGLSSVSLTVEARLDRRRAAATG